MMGVPVLLLYNLDPSWPAEDRDIAVQEAERLASGLGDAGHPVSAVAVGHSDLQNILRPYDPREWIVFNWCEELPGIPRSDVQAAEILESAGFTYTGPAPDVLRLSWDKSETKRLLDHQRLPTPRWRVCGGNDPAGWHRFPAMVKPVHQHCSIGVTGDSVVRNDDELQARIAFIHDMFRQPALVEDFIDGREFHVSLWGNDDVRMLPVAEMDFSRFEDIRDRLCTYESKFQPGSRHYDGIQTRLPATLEEGEFNLLYRTAQSAYRACRCRDFARLDIRLDKGTFYILDVNPNPDLSSDASMACAAETAGLSFGMMGSHIIALAAARHPIFGQRRRPVFV